jgi:DNA integrity scanning protein DisA with diadenylate cyclase activity
MSAIETSVRPEVVATVTLSEETGRVSVFRDGEANSMRREEIGGRWRCE